MDRSLPSFSQGLFLCRKDNKVSYGYSVMRGKRAGMEDFFFAEVMLKCGDAC